MGFLIYQVMFEIVVSLEDLFRLFVRKGYWVPQVQTWCGLQTRALALNLWTLFQFHPTLGLDYEDYGGWGPG